MPRNYVRKTNNASYSHEKLLEAVEAVKSGRLSGYEASKLYQIPRPTIVNRVYGRKGLKSKTLGRPAVLTREVEEDLVRNLHVMEKYGLGLTRKELLEAVGQYVLVNSIKNPFKNGMPGEDWFLSFKKKHGLSIKKPQPVEYARKQACSPHIIHPYFDLLEETMKELKLTDKPSHVWNVDETSFSKDPSKAKVIGCKGFTSTRTIASPGKDNTTVLLGCNALGEKTPPMIVFKGKNVWDQWTTDEGYPGTAYAATSNGWMETPVFEAFFEKVFLPTVGQKRPILLIYDGHATHVGVNLVKKAREANITILKIPPHTSHLLQPLDLSVNKSFKDKWDIALVKWQRMNIGKVLPKQDFAKIIGQIWGDLDPAICAAGFRKAGIYPLNKNVVFENKLISSTNYYNTNNLTKDCIETLKPCAGTSKQIDSFIKEKSPKTGLLQPESLLTLSLKIIAKMDTTETSFSHTLPMPLQNDCVDLSIQLGAKSSVFNSMNILEQTTKVHPSTSPKVTILENRIVSFEELLLMKIKAGTSSRIKKKRVATGAEVITRDDVYKRTLEVNAHEMAKKEKKTKIKQQDSKQIKDTQNILDKKIKKKGKAIKKRKNVSSSESETEIIYADDSDDNNFWDNLLNKSDDEDDIVITTKNDDEKENFDFNNPFSENDWLLVKFCTKKTVKHYVGTVLKINHYGYPLVKYARKKGKSEGETVFSFPQVDDISELKHTEDIVTKLPKPSIGRRGQIIFKMSFNSFNIQ